MEEEWKAVKGYEGKYEVSSTGLVRSIGNYYPIRGGGQQFRDGKILAQRMMSNGYVSVCLSRNHKTKTKYVHRLVAEAFVANPFQYGEVNHKDEDKTNNSKENLEWCSHLYNINYGNCRAKISSSRRKSPLIGEKVSQYTLDGKYIKTYKCAQDAGRETGCDPSAIRKCCNRKKKFNTVHGFIWKNADM
jgi:hypothetical protein